MNLSEPRQLLSVVLSQLDANNNNNNSKTPTKRRRMTDEALDNCNNNNERDLEGQLKEIICKKRKNMM